MKHIFLNLKRFDISPEHGGVNRLAPMRDWGRTIVEQTQEQLRAFPEAEFVMYMPEAHLIAAAAARTARRASSAARRAASSRSCCERGLKVLREPVLKNESSENDGLRGSLLSCC